jgi:hypothetical protein
VDRRTRNALALLFAIVIAVTAFAALLLSETRPPTDPNAPPGTTAVVGVVVGVDSQDLGDVRGFTLRETGTGALLEFDLQALENGSEFAPGHLAEHQATAEPVRVWYRDDGSRHLAIRVEDSGT